MKNKIFEFLQIIGVSLIIFLLVIYFPSTDTNNGIDCNALNEFYNINYLGDFFKILLALAVTIVVWLISLLIYYILRSNKKVNLYIYFTAATLLSLSPLLFKPKVKKSTISQDMKKVICEKGNDDGMFLKLNNLSENEYNYLRSLKKWWPEIPSRVDSINIEYYRDDFLGDFSFDVNLNLPNGVKLDSLKYPKWVIIDGKYHFSILQN